MPSQHWSQGGCQQSSCLNWEIYQESGFIKILHSEINWTWTVQGSTKELRICSDLISVNLSQDTIELLWVLYLGTVIYTLYLASVHENFIPVVWFIFNNVFCDIRLSRTFMSHSLYDLVKHPNQFGSHRYFKCKDQ